MSCILSVNIPIHFYQYISCENTYTETSCITLTLKENTTARPIACSNPSSTTLFNTQSITTNSNFIPAPGYTINKDDVIKLFQRNIGQYISEKTFVQKGEDAPNPPSPIICISFAPSSENLAKFMFQELYSLINRSTNGCLSSIALSSYDYSVIYSIC